MAGVSLIVATHERVAALQETLPSLLAVAGVEELVFVDDGSTDGTADLLRAIPDARVRVVLQPRRLGLPAARNRGWPSPPVHGRSATRPAAGARRRRCR